MKNIIKKSFNILLLMFFLFLLSCATTGQPQWYNEGRVIDRGIYSLIGPPGDGWLVNMQGGVTQFFRVAAYSGSDQIIIMAVRNDFDAKKGRYPSEEEVALDFLNRIEEVLIKNAREANCVTNDMKKGTTIIGDKKLYFISSIATGCTGEAARRGKVSYIFFPADFNERHTFYQFVVSQFRDKMTPFKGVDLKLITPVIDSLKIKPQVEAKPKDAKTYFQMGHTHLQKGDYDQAIYYFSKSIEMDPNNPWAYNNRGAAYVAEGYYDRAISNYTKALEIDPKNASFYCNRAIAFCLNEQYDQAILDCNKALEIDPRNAGAYNERGIAYRHKGQYDQAISDYTKALEIDQKYAIKAYFNRGISHSDKGEHDLAISDFNKTIDLNSKHAEAYYNRGKCYYFKKEYNKSWDDIKRTQDLGYKIPPEFLDELRKASGREN